MSRTNVQHGTSGCTWKLWRRIAANRAGRRDRRALAALVALIGLAALLAIAYWWATLQDDPDPVEPAPAAVASSTTSTTVETAESSTLLIERVDNEVLLDGTVGSESERDALAAAVTNAGYDVDNRITVSSSVTDSDPRVIAALLTPLLDGTDDGGLELADGSVTITGEALDPVEAEEIQSAIDLAATAGLVVEDRTTVRVLPEEVQIAALQEEIDQIFELAREIDGQYPNFDVSDGELSAGAMTTLDRVAVAMRRYPLPAADILGHTDATGSESTNQTLSETRAQNVLDYLVGVGVEPGRLTAVGRGEGDPVADNSTDAGRAENRRVDFVVRKRGG